MTERAALAHALDLLRKGGAAAAEALKTRTRWLKQTSSGKPPTSGEAVVWTLHAWLPNGATGVGVGVTAAEAAERAIAALHAALPEPFAGPTDRPDARPGGLGINDRRYANIEPADRNELLALAETALRTVPQASLAYEQAIVERAWGSTRGAEAQDTQTTFVLAAVATLPSGPLTHRIASRHFADVASLPFGADLRRRVLPLTKPLDGPLPDLPVLIEPWAMAEIARSFAPAFAADRPSFVNTLIAAAKKPPVLAPPVFHMTDDAGLHSGLHATPFDDRGVTPLPLTLLREGVIGARYHSPSTARASSARPTGHVRGDQLHPSNLIIRPGARTRNVIHGELGDLLLLDAPPPFDLLTGRFVGPVRYVRVHEGETIGFYAADMDLTLTQLLSAIVEFAADQERHIGVDTPTAVLACPPVSVQS